MRLDHRRGRGECRLTLPVSPEAFGSLSAQRAAYFESRHMMLKERVAIVTGAGGGLGRSHAMLLARYGARVVVNDMDLSLATRVADEIVASGGQAIAVAASV